MTYPILSLLFACGDSTKTTDSGSVQDDTGTTTLDPNDYESGCFIVDGGNGFASFSDAMLFAEEGSTIALIDCEEARHEEKILIDKSINLVGNSSWTLVAPVNETAITITAPNVIIQDLNIESTRSAIFVDGASDVTLTNLLVFSAGNWAVKTKEATNLSIENPRFENNGFGGINIIGGSASISNATIDFNTSVGIKIEEEAVVDITTATISNTSPSNPTAPSDGIGIWAVDSTVTATDIIMDGNFLAGVQGDGSDMSLSNATISNVIGAGVWTEPGFGDTILTNVSIFGSYNYGIVYQSSGAFTLVDTTIVGDPEVGPSTNAEDWISSGLTGTGIFTAATTISMTNTEITGYNNCGLYAANESSEASLDMSGVHIHDVGRIGAFVFGHETNVADSTFENIFDLDGVQELGIYEICYTVDRYGAFLALVGDFSFENSTFARSASYGISVVQGSATFSGGTFENNTCSGAMIFDSSGIMDGMTMNYPNAEYGSFGASVLGYNASYVKVSNSTLLAEEANIVYDFHIFLYNTSSADIINNTISGGYYGIYAQSSELTVEDNIFSNQQSYGYSTIVRYDSEPSDSANLLHSFSGNTYTTVNPGTRGIYCESGGSIDASGEVFSEHLGGNVIYTTNCSTTLEDITLSNTVQGINVYGGNHEWDGLSFDGVSQTDYAIGAIQVGICPSYICDVQNPVFISLSNSSFQNIGNIYTDGIRFSSSNLTEAPIEAYLNGITLENIGGDGIYATNSNLSIDNLSITTTGETGFYLSTGSTSTITTSTLSDGGSQGVYCIGCTLTMSSTTISNYDSEGLSLLAGTTALDAITLSSNGVEDERDSVLVEGGTLIANNLSISGAGAHGVHSLGTASVTLENSSIELSTLSGLNLASSNNIMNTLTLTENAEYGMTCDASASVSCSVITHTNNQLGEQSGCDASCGVDADQPR